MNLEALKAAIKLIADAVNDSMKNGKDIAGYANLLPDVMANRTDLSGGNGPSAGGLRDLGF
jgi:hypothetical protein